MHPLLTAYNRILRAQPEIVAADVRLDGHVLALALCPVDMEAVVAGLEGLRRETGQVVVTADSPLKKDKKCVEKIKMRVHVCSTVKGTLEKKPSIYSTFQYITRLFILYR